MKRPEFFIVGAPKSGTTFLTRRLAEHPDIFMPVAKELHYFGSDLEFRVKRRTFDEYMTHFTDARNDQTVGEASVLYMFSSRAAKEIHDYDPDAKIIIMLRNPADLLYSLHSQYLYSGDENLRDFEEALAAEGDRRKGLRVPSRNGFPRGLLYSELVTFSPQVRRYLNLFPCSQILFLFFDELAARPAEIVNRTIGFLGASPLEVVAPDAVNANRRVRNLAIQRMVRRPPRPIGALARFLLPERVRLRTKTLVDEINVVEERRSPIDPDVRRRLLDRFRPDLVELQELTGKDLSHWMGDPGEVDQTSTSTR